MTIMRITLEFTDPTNIWEIRRRIDQLVYHLVDRGIAFRGHSTVDFPEDRGLQTPEQNIPLLRGESTSTSSRSRPSRTWRSSTG